MPRNELSPTARSLGLLPLYLAFLRLGATSFGGGTAGWLHREIVLKRGWIDNRSFLRDLLLGATLFGVVAALRL